MRVKTAIGWRLGLMRDMYCAHELAAAFVPCFRPVHEPDCRFKIKLVGTAVFILP